MLVRASKIGKEGEKSIGKMIKACSKCIAVYITQYIQMYTNSPDPRPSVYDMAYRSSVINVVLTEERKGNL